MRKDQLHMLIEARGLSMTEVATMSSRSRAALGLPTIIPETDYTPLQRFVDSMLPGFDGLRRLFGLDREVVNDPIYTLDDDNGKASQIYQRNLSFSNQRGPVYTLVEEMDTYDIVCSALDLYAEEATQQDPETQRVVWIESDNAQVRSTLMDLLTRLNMDDRAFQIIRTMCKYGDSIEQVVTAEGIGVKQLLYVHPSRVTRVEDKFGHLQGFCAGIVSLEDSTWEKIEDKPQMVSYPWDFVHFRIMSNNRESRHGDSILLGARRAYQQLKMIEDMLVLSRISRGMDRDVYYVGIAGQTPTQGWGNVNQFRHEIRKKLGINPTAGSMRQEYNVITPDNDLFIPVTGPDDPTRVERQTGSGPMGDIPDVDHFRRKLLGALRTPAAFIGFEVDTPAKATLSSQYPRFARAIKRIQRGFKQGIRWLCEIHLIRLGIPTRDEDGRLAVRFTVKMAAIDQLEELAKMDVYNARVDLVTKMLELSSMQQQPDPQTGLIIPQSGMVKNIDAWTAWVLRNFMSCTDSEIGMFLGDEKLGLTPDMIEIRSLTEKAKSNGILSRFEETTKPLLEAIRICKESDDDDGLTENVDFNGILSRHDESADESEVDSSSDDESDATKFSYVDSGFNLDKQEEELASSLKHVGGPIIKCPKCKSASMMVKKDKITESVYTLCKCGYMSFLGDER